MTDSHRAQANVLRSLFFLSLILALAACAEDEPTATPLPSPTTRVVVLVATNTPVTPTITPTATTPPSNTPIPSLAPINTAAPSATATRIPPTRVPATSTNIPPTPAPTAIPVQPTDVPAVQQTDVPATIVPNNPPTEPPNNPTPVPSVVEGTQPPNNPPIQPPASFAPTELVFISGGLLKMGGKAQEDDPDEKPFHDVEMYEFNIEKYEVTNAQYQACVAAGVCPLPTKSGSGTRASHFGDPAFADYPVVNVTWTDADTYCKWVGRRLPNEGEWERAAKGTENWRYTWSNSIGMHFEWNAIFHGSPISFCEASCPLQTYWTDVNDGFPDTAPVGRFGEYDNSSGFGVIDMAGNVAEWTNNWYDGNAYINGSDIYGPSEPTGTKVVRGGSWAEEPHRNSDREPQAPDYSSDRIGLRCAQ